MNCRPLVFNWRSSSKDPPQFSQFLNYCRFSKTRLNDLTRCCVCLCRICAAVFRGQHGGMERRLHKLQWAILQVGQSALWNLVQGQVGCQEQRGLRAHQRNHWGQDAWKRWGARTLLLFVRWITALGSVNRYQRINQDTGWSFSNFDPCFHLCFYII